MYDGWEIVKQTGGVLETDKFWIKWDSWQLK